MKAIKITPELKADNPKIFGHMQVGKLYTINLPDELKVGKQLHLGYKSRTNLHAKHGFKDFEAAPYDHKTEELGELYETDEGKVTNRVEPLSADELEKKIPREVPSMYFELKLSEKNISSQDIVDTIHLAKSQGLIKEKKHRELLIKWNKSNVIERSNQDLFDLIPLLNQQKGYTAITQDEVLDIFKNYA